MNISLFMNCASEMHQPREMETGWRAEVCLDVTHRSGKSVLGNCSRKGPLTFQRPFYPENDVCHLYLLHPPGGIVGGDSIHLDIHSRKKTHALVTTPGATKFYRSQGPQACQRQSFNLESTGVLEWFPQETILFPGAEAKMDTQVKLAGEALFFGWEILCLGRPASQMTFDQGSLNTRFCVYQDGIPRFIDRLDIDSRTRSESIRTSRPGLQGLPVSGVFIIAGIPSEMGLEKEMEMLSAGFEKEKNAGETVGMTRINDIFVARHLGHDPEAAKAYFITIWKTLRPMMLNRDACIPRIWAT